MQYVSIYIKFKRDAYISGKTLKKNTSLGYLESQESDNLGGGGNRLGRTPGGRWLCALSFFCVLFLDLGDRHMNVCIL